eukprot:1160817-Pelagomonas_calceolata.AAC.6
MIVDSFLHAHDDSLRHTWEPPCSLCRALGVLLAAAPAAASLQYRWGSRLNCIPLGVTALICLSRPPVPDHDFPCACVQLVHRAARP